MHRVLASWIAFALSTAVASAAPTGAIDFDASSRSARTLLGELVAADTSNPSGRPAFPTA
jgi:hypothetical protein